MVKIAIFGATGFIGRHVCAAAISDGIEVHAICRRADQLRSFDAEVHTHLYEDIADSSAKASFLTSMDCLLHLADNPDRNTAEDNYSLAITKRIGKIAVSVGVKNFIYISSAYASVDAVGEDNVYGSQKRASEKWLLEQTSLKTIILRIPPVYGPQSKGGIHFLASLVAKGIPIPFGSAEALRDYLSVSNFAELIIKIAHMDLDGWDMLQGRHYSVSDGTPISTAQLVVEISRKLGVGLRLWSIPKPVLTFLGKISGRSAQINAALRPLICGNSSDLMTVAKWQPQKTTILGLDYLISSE